MLTRTRPAGVVAALLRAPDVFYRWRLGWLLGDRFLRLSHVGRRSGLVRRTVLEVARYDPDTRESVVVAAWGERSDWYRNVRVRPALLVETGRRRYTPRQRFLTEDELGAVLAAYAREHRLSAHLIYPLLGVRADGSGEAGRAPGDRVRGVAFRPTNGADRTGDGSRRTSENGR